MVKLHDPVSLALDTADETKTETDIKSILREFGLQGGRLRYVPRTKGNNPNGNNGPRRTREARLKLRSFN